MTADTDSPKLSPAQFRDTADLLTQLSRSRSALVRRNTIVAWSELIARTADPVLRRDAVTHLIDTALAHGDDSESEVATRAMAAQELISFDKDLISHAKRRLIDEISMKKGADRARRAAELALAVVTRTERGGAVSGWRSITLTIGSYLSLLRLSLGQWLITFRDGLGFLLGWSLLGAIIFGGICSLISVDQLSSRGEMPPYALGAAGAIFLLATMACAFAVPSRTIRGGARLLDAICLVVVTAAVLYVGTLLMTSDGISDTGPVLLRIVLAGVAGVLASRLVTHILTGVSDSGRFFAPVAGGLVGGTATYLVVAYALPEAGGQEWLPAMAIVIGVTIGGAWADYRRGATYIALPSRPTDAAWRIGGWILVGASVLFLGATFYRYQSQVAAGEKQVLADILKPTSAEIITLPCSPGTVALQPAARVGRYYAVALCPGRGLKVTAITPEGEMEVPEVTMDDASFVPSRTRQSNKYPSIRPEVLRYDQPYLHHNRFGIAEPGASPTDLNVPWDRLTPSARQARVVRVCLTGCPQVNYNKSLDSAAAMYGRAWTAADFAALIREDTENPITVRMALARTGTAAGLSPLDQKYTLELTALP